MSRNVWGVAWLLAAGLCLPSLAVAENLEEFGLGPRAQAMGGAVLEIAMVRIAAEFTTGKAATRSLKVGVAF